MHIFKSSLYPWNSDDKIIKEGDILGLDVGSLIDGYYGDAARTIAIGEVSPTDKALISCAKDALYHAIDIIRDGMRFKELSAALGESMQEVLSRFVDIAGMV